MLAARLAIAEEMTAPGPRRTKNPRDVLALPPLLPRRKSCRIARTVSEDPPLPEMIFPDAVNNFLADGLNLESLDSVIAFHARMCNTEGCNGPCNHDGKIITGASFDSDDDEDDHGPSDHLDDEDDSMEPAPVTASKPALEAMIAELKEKCINTINDKFATFLASLRGDFIDRARTAVIGEKFYWCEGLCDYYTKSLMSGKTLEDVNRSKFPSSQFNDQILVRVAQMLATGIMFCNFRGECKRTPDGKNCMNPTPEEAIKIVEVINAFARLADTLRGAVVLQICGGKQASIVMLPKLKESMKASGIGIIILNENLLHMSHNGRINPRVFFTKELQQYLVYKDFHQLHLSILVRVAQMLATGIMFCNFRGECKRTPDGKNCMNPTPEEAIKIVEVINAFARLADTLRGAVVLQICGGKQASIVMLPKLKESMKASGIGIIILNENLLHMSHNGRINPRVFFTKELQQYLVYKDFHQLHLSLAKALKQLKTMGILEDSTITFSQMLEWAQPLDGIKDHSNTPAETTNAYDADYKKRCVIRGAKFSSFKATKVVAKSSGQSQCGLETCQE
jgi:hypothetical protein